MVEFDCLKITARWLGNDVSNKFFDAYSHQFVIFEFMSCRITVKTVVPFSLELQVGQNCLSQGFLPGRQHMLG